MNNIKGIFFDIDGTLFLASQKKIPDSAVEALLKAHENGVKLFLATGRGREETLQLDTCGIPFDGYVVLNGQMCFDQEWNLLHSITIEEEDKNILVKLFEEKQVAMGIVEKDGFYLNFVDDMVKRIHDDIAFEYPKTGEYQGAEIYQFMIYTTPEEAQQYMSQTTRSKMHFWHPWGADILHIDSGKASGIEKMQVIHGLKREEIMTFGDGDNDIDMISYAGIGVAMGNASDDVKHHADYVTSSIEEDGIKNALEHFGLI